MDTLAPHPFPTAFAAHLDRLDTPALFQLAQACTRSLEGVLRQGFEAVNEGFNPLEGTKPIVLVRENLFPLLSTPLGDPGAAPDLGEPKIVFDYFKSQHPVDLALKALQDRLLLVGSDASMKVYTAFTNTLEKTIHGGLSANEPLFFPAAEAADTLYVVFAGMVCFPEFKKSLEQVGRIDQLHILDPNRSWYMQGLDGDWNGYETYRELLGLRIGELKAAHPYRRVCFLGNSMGGSAACLFSEHADTVLAFCPQTVIPSENVPSEVKERYSRLMAENLNASLAAGKPIVVHRGVAPNDIIHCGRLPAGVRQIVHEDCDVHNVPGFLKTKGILPDILGSIR